MKSLDTDTIIVIIGAIIGGFFGISLFIFVNGNVMTEKKFMAKHGLEYVTVEVDGRTHYKVVGQIEDWEYPWEKSEK